MTNAQLTALKTLIASEPANQTRNDAEITAWCNEASATIVWRTYVDAQEVMANGFVWTAVDGLTAGKARIWDWLTRYGGFNPSKANVRQGLVDAFGAASAMANGIMPHLKRTATRAEGAMASGTGTDASPSTLTYEGTVSTQDVIDALTRG
jgi:hypothetical protein